MKNDTYTATERLLDTISKQRLYYTDEMHRQLIDFIDEWESLCELTAEQLINKEININDLHKDSYEWWLEHNYSEYIERQGELYG